LGAETGVYNADGVAEGWCRRALLVDVAPHVDVAAFAVDGEDVAETIAIPVADVEELTVMAGVEDSAMTIPPGWGLDVPGGI
tara:strand:+ start:13021 stop:13266 length:246 start_codon:yes stop_codon:yes gene_type:complete